jgi:DNA-binding HxlR family transcriptional regulator
MDVLAKRWTGQVCFALEGGPLRFGELRAAVGSIGERMLSVRLRELEARGLVERRVVAGPPVRVEYELTSTGRGFRGVAEAIRQWGDALLIVQANGAKDEKKDAKPTRGGVGAHEGAKAPCSARAGRARRTQRAGATR